MGKLICNKTAKDITRPGRYDICMDCESWWLDIGVYERDGKLWLVNPTNNKETPLNGIIGWSFRESEA